ncbi:hypothetical protein D3C76_506290 [compost metagenome]
MVDVEDVGHDPHHGVRHAIGRNQAQQQQCLPAVAHDEVVDRCQHRRQAASAHGRQAHAGEDDVQDGAQEGPVIEQQVEQAGTLEQHAGEIGVVQLGEHGRHGDQQDDQDEHRHQLVAEAIARCRQLRTQRYGGLTHHQAGDQCRQHQGTEQHVGAGPGLMKVGEASGTEPLGKKQRTGGGQQRSDAITGHVAGGQGRLTAVLGNFQAIGVDGDVLGRGCKSNQYRQGDQPGQVLLRVAKTHADQADDHQGLGQHQPGTTPTELAEQGQAPLVEQGRPHPLEGIGQANQAGIANGFTGNAGFSQPDGERRKNQHIRHAGGKTEQQEYERRRAGISGERGAPGFTGHGLESASDYENKARTLTAVIHRAPPMAFHIHTIIRDIDAFGAQSCPLLVA